MMKNKTKETLELLQEIMQKRGFADYCIEALLQNEKGDIASYTACYTKDEYKDELIYIDGFEYTEKINEDNPCVWLASLLNLDYKILYCSLSFHCMIWALYYDYYCEIESYMQGLDEYLRYCKQHHISASLLELYCGREFDDIADRKFCERYNGYSILDRITVDEQAFLFAINEEAGTFAVYDSNCDYTEYSNQKMYTSYLEAFNDFQERIKKCWYDKMRDFNEKYFFSCGGDEELNSIMNGRINQYENN